MSVVEHSVALDALLCERDLMSWNAAIPCCVLFMRNLVLLLRILTVL